MFDKLFKNKKWRRTIIEYLIIGGIVLFLYSSGYYVEVIGRLQQVVLWTGLMQPDIEQPINNQSTTATDMKLVSLSGKPVNLRDFRGKVVFLNFWATWCPPCVAEMPDIQSLYKKYEQNPDIAFIMVSLDEKPEKARKFIQRKAFTFPVYMPGGRIPDALLSHVVPTTFVLDRDGNVIVRRKGMAEYDTKQFRNFLDAQIDSSK